VPLLNLFYRFGVWRVYFPWVARRNYAREPLADSDWRTWLLPEGLRTQSTRGDNPYLWRDLQAWCGDTAVTILYL
jgi:hypothetical protein